MPNVAVCISNFAFQLDPSTLSLVVEARVENVAGSFGGWLQVSYGLSDADVVAAVRAFVIDKLAEQASIVLDPATPIPIYGGPATSFSA